MQAAHRKRKGLNASLMPVVKEIDNNSLFDGDDNSSKTSAFSTSGEVVDNDYYFIKQEHCSALDDNKTVESFEDVPRAFQKESFDL